MFLNHNVAFFAGNADHRVAELFGDIEANRATGTHNCGDIDPFRVEEKPVHVEDDSLHRVWKYCHVTDRK